MLISSFASVVDSPSVKLLKIFATILSLSLIELKLTMQNLDCNSRFQMHSALSLLPRGTLCPGSRSRSPAVETNEIRLHSCYTRV